LREDYAPTPATAAPAEPLREALAVWLKGFEDGDIVSNERRAENWWSEMAGKHFKLLASTPASREPQFAECDCDARDGHKLNCAAVRAYYARTAAPTTDAGVWQAWEDLKSRTSDCPYCETEWPEHAIPDCPYKQLEAALAQQSPTMDAGVREALESIVFIWDDEQNTIQLVGRLSKAIPAARAALAQQEAGAREHSVIK
jgi:hypothetical protein